MRLNLRKTDSSLTALFHDAELRAEKLVAYLRLLMSGSLAAVFLLVLTLEPIPLSDVLRWQMIYAVATMAAYFAWGLLSLALLRAGQFRLWMIWPSALGDCAFILLSAWLSVVNTGVAGSYLPIMPTLWLSPIVLACGALRFRPVLQIVMGVVLVTGLAAILIQPAATGAPTDSTTFDFFFALPPNVMRLTMLAIAAGVLVVATIRTRQLFWRAITDAKARANLTRYLPEQLAGRLAQEDLQSLRSGTRIEAGLLFADMRDFTQISEQMDPADLSLFMSDFRARISQAAAESGGIIDKFMGDAVLIVFPNDAPAALRCAQHLRQGIAEWSEERQAEGKDPVQIGIGLHFGRVFSGVVGDESRLEYSVFGDAVNVTARLEELTKDKGQSVLASGAFVERAGVDLGAWSKLADEYLRGRAGAIAVFALS